MIVRTSVPISIVPVFWTKRKLSATTTRIVKSEVVQRSRILPTGTTSYQDMGARTMFSIIAAWIPRATFRFDL